MTRRPESQTYIARAVCGCMKLAISMYKGERPDAYTVRLLAHAMQEGYTIEKVSTEYVRTHFVSRCEVCDPPKPIQEVLV